LFREQAEQKIIFTSETSGATIPAAAIKLIMSDADPEKFIMSVLDFVLSKGASIFGWLGFVELFFWFFGWVRLSQSSGYFAANGGSFHHSFIISGTIDRYLRPKQACQETPLTTKK
jgi:hypothetical protein